MLQKKLTYINLIILFFCPLCSLSNIIEEGLSYQIFNPQKKSDIGTSEILIESSSNPYGMLLKS